MKRNQGKKNYKILLRPKQNPFERPKPKVLNQQEIKNNTNKKLQIQKVGNFRDQLNKGMLESAAKGSESIKEEVPEKNDIEDKPKNMEPPKIKSKSHHVSMHQTRLLYYI